MKAFLAGATHLLIDCKRWIKVIIGAAALLSLPSATAAEDSNSSHSLTVLNYETGWTHDGAGYHPAIFMALENNTGRDLTDSTIKFQARFTDVETTEVTIGRKNVRRPLKPHQQFNVAIIGRESSNGLEGFELPFEISYWPKLETKVMCRVGEVNDEGTETLLIAKLDAETRSEDSAFDDLNQTASYVHHKMLVTPPVPADKALLKKIAQGNSATQTERPLLASAQRYPAHSQAPRSFQPYRRTDEPRIANQQSSGKHHEESTSTVALLSEKTLPGLGDDFFNFEQRFGLPITVDAKQSTWTWAKYRHTGSNTDILAGAHDRGAKVDVIVIMLPKVGNPDGAALVPLAKQMAGKFRAQPLPPASKSVRYLPSGRLELAASHTSGYRVICLVPPGDSDNHLVLILSRLPQDPQALLAGLSHKSSLLKPLEFLDNK